MCWQQVFPLRIQHVCKKENDCKWLSKKKQTNCILRMTQQPCVNCTLCTVYTVAESLASTSLGNLELFFSLELIIPRISLMAGRIKKCALIIACLHVGLFGPVDCFDERQKHGLICSGLGEHVWTLLILKGMQFSWKVIKYKSKQQYEDLQLFSVCVISLFFVASLFLSMHTHLHTLFCLLSGC